MILILASAFDATASALAEQWPAAGARVVTPRDLSRPGWRLRLGDAAGGMAMAGGEPIADSSIRGVVTRLPWIDPRELVHVMTEDRDYVAAEMQAYLVAWLSQLTCPMLNRPTPLCLCGPGWRREQWFHAAARLGLPTARLRRVHSLNAPQPESRDAAAVTAVVVVGEEVIGDCDDGRRDHLRQLAAAAGVGLLGLDFDAGGDLCGTSLWPDLSRPGVTQALHRYFGKPEIGRRKAG